MRSKIHWNLIFALTLLPAAALADAPRQLLVIEPTPAHPRNSEGDLIELADGRLCLIYTRFRGGTSDHAAADNHGLGVAGKILRHLTSPWRYSSSRRSQPIRACFTSAIRTLPGRLKDSPTIKMPPPGWAGASDQRRKRKARRGKAT